MPPSSSDITDGGNDRSPQKQPTVAPRGEPTPVLSLQGAAKAFDGVHALEGVSLDLYAGEAHALVGENGAGKSTLVKILGGVHQPDVGVMLMDGREIVLGGTADARAAGIAVIYQEPTLFPDLSVAENVFIGRQPLRSGRRIDYRAMDAEVNRIFERLGVRMDPDRIARGLSIAEQQLVEIAKALSSEAKVLIMDEPTAALSPVEVERLFRIVGNGSCGRCRHPLHFTPPGRGIRALSAGHDPPRRKACPVPEARGTHGRRSHPRHGRTRSSIARAMRSTPRAPPSSRLIVSPMRACSRTSRLRSVPERWSRSPDWSAPAAARWPERSSGSIATTPARCGSAARPCAGALR